MKSTILLLLLAQLSNTDTIKPLPVPVDRTSVESQFRMYVYLAKFVQICRPHFHINRAMADVEVVKLRTEVMSLSGASPEMYDEAVKVETDIRTLAVKMIGEKAWCDTNKFVLTAHGYGRIFSKEQQESKELK